MQRPPMIRLATVLALILLAGWLAQRHGRGQSPGEKYALLVGVREYNPAEPLPALAYTEDDMDALARVLVGAGYPRRNIKLMTQRDGAKNTRFLPVAEKIRSELELTLERLEPEDTVLVALAGHGVQFEANGPSFFCPADAVVDEAEVKTLINLDELARSLERCRAGFKLLLVDACRNNPKIRRQRAAGRPVVELPSLSRPFADLPPGGVAAMFSCSAGQVAFEDEELKHGVFFHYVIEGLQGAADRDRDGQVEVEELASFAKKNVARFVDERRGRKQYPELINRTRGSVAIASPGRRAGSEDAVAKSEGGEIASRSPASVPTPPSPPKTLTNSIGMKLMLIPAGEFLMGSSDDDQDAEDREKPRHRVRITRPFYLGATEVTQGQFRTVTGENPSRFKGSDDLPVEKVSWNDAIAFCNKLSEREGLQPYYRFGAGQQSGGAGYRLPTEAEWEYACRAGTTTRYSFGDEESSLGEYAWFDGNSESKTHPVGQKRPNAFGLYDMHGNVWEWCWDGLDSAYYKESPGADPTGPLQAAARVYRGGGWSFDPRLCRSAGRYGGAPGGRGFDLGFRVARVRSGG